MVDRRAPRLDPSQPAPPLRVEPAPPATEWVPGDPLHPVQNASYRAVFSVRDDSQSEVCDCNDAADWPEQRHRRLPDGDELGDFIAAVHAEREAASS